jgi:hypothetical protein
MKHRSENHPEDCPCVVKDDGTEILSAECLSPEDTRDFDGGFHGRKKCEACLETFDRLKLHQKQSQNHLLCEICGKYFLKEDAEAEPHPYLGDKELIQYSCPRCGKTHESLDKAGEGE